MHNFNATSKRKRKHKSSGRRARRGRSSEGNVQDDEAVWKDSNTATTDWKETKGSSQDYECCFIEFILSPNSFPHSKIHYYIILTMGNISQHSWVSCSSFFFLSHFLRIILTNKSLLSLLKERHRHAVGTKNAVSLKIMRTKHKFIVSLQKPCRVNGKAYICSVFC